MEARPKNSSSLLIIAMNICTYSMLFLMTGAGICIFPFIFPFAKLTTGWETGRIARLCVWMYGKGWLAIVSPFIHFQKEGFSENSIRPPCILVVNHLSAFDAYFMGALPISDVSFAIRSWPFKIPFYRPFMKMAGYLDVETMEWKRLLGAFKHKLDKGESILFFPEAHRSRDGQLGRFFSGAFKLATVTGTKIVPLCISGTDVFFPPGRWWLSPARVRLRVLPPVDPQEFPGSFGHIRMRKWVKRIMASNLIEMRDSHESTAR